MVRVFHLSWVWDAHTHMENSLWAFQCFLFFFSFFSFFFSFFFKCGYCHSHWNAAPILFCIQNLVYIDGPTAGASFTGSVLYWYLLTYNISSNQVQASSSSLSPSPRLNRSPSPGLSGLKRLEPNSSKEFLPHQQPRPIPSLSGFKRLAPTFSKQCLPHQQRHPIYISHPLENLTDPFFCKVCQVPCSSAVTYKSHIRGYKHRAIGGELKFGRKDGAEVAEVRSEWKKCEFCNVWCMDDDAL